MSKKRKQRHVEDDFDSANVAQKRRRQYSEQDAKLAKIYDDLTHEVKSTRIRAAAALLKVLEKDHRALDNILVRLIRGLCSSRKAARSGFFIALTEVLRDAKPDADGIIEKITEETQAESGAAAQEKRDRLFGRMFGYRAVIQSSVVFSQNASIDVWKRLLDLMLLIPEAAPILREECFMSLFATVEQLARQNLAQNYAEVMLQKLCDHNVAQTPGGVAIWLEIHDRFPELELPRDVWHKDDPLSKKELSRLANVMKETNTESIHSEPEEGASNLKGQKARTGTRRALPSFAWDVIFEHSLKRSQERKERQHPSKSMFSMLWNAIVDESLFAESASPERKALGFQVLTKVITKGPYKDFAAVFSKNLMKCLMNQRSHPERFLHEAAKAPLDALRKRFQGDPSLTADTLDALLGEHGHVNFDQLTRTKTVDGIMTTSDSAPLLRTVQIFERLIQGSTPGDERDVEASRRVLADHLLSAVRSRFPNRAGAPDPLEEERDTGHFLDSVLRLFVRFGYCRNVAGTDESRVPRPPLSANTRNMFRSRLSSCLAHVLSAALDKSFRLSYEVIEAIYSPSRVVHSDLEAIFEAEKGINKQVKRAVKALRNIRLEPLSAAKENVPALLSISLLYSLTLLQIYNGDADAVDMLSDIETCYDQVIKKASSGQDAMTLLVEVLLSFLAKPSVLFRRLAEQVSAAFAAELSPNSLDALTEVLYKPENMSGQGQLFEIEDDAIEREGGSSPDEASDVAKKEPDSSSGDASSSEGDEKDTPEDSDLENDSGSEANTDQEKSTELMKFDQLLADALKTQPADSAMPNGEESSSDEAMDDEQMMALEPHLTKIFEERKKSSTKKNEQRDAKETVVNFKSRVLDLLTIYVKQQHANPIATSIILPLLVLIRTTNTKHLFEKAFNLLKTYFDACKGGKGLPAPPLQSTVDLLSDVHQEFMKSVSKIHVSACSRSSLFLVKVLLGLDQKNYREAARRYEETQVRWYEKPKSKVTGSFFTEWTSWSMATTKYS